MNFKYFDICYTCNGNTLHWIKGTVLSNIIYKNLPDFFHGDWHFMVLAKIFSKIFIMYILAFDLFRKEDKYIFKARNSCCMGGIVSLSIYIFSVWNKSDDYFFVHQKSLIPLFKPFFFRYTIVICGSGTENKIFVTVWDKFALYSVQI